MKIPRLATRVLRRALLAAAAWCAAACSSIPSSPATMTRAAPAPRSPRDTAEAHRPLFHFTPPAEWMNDPNGMVYFDGEYHLFYQHYPDSTVWGPMHWGHAISTDLVHWQDLPIALAPDSLGLIFSGSAVVDSLNTSGFGVDGTPPLVAMFTYHNMAQEKAGAAVFQTQGIAYSTDRGRTWTKYAGNPVVPNPGLRDMRDPKIVWHAPTKRWIMVLAAGNQVRLYASRTLRDWLPISEFGIDVGAHGGVWECPDLFPITIEGTNETRWVLMVSINPGAPNGGSATQYFVGNFDGRAFTLDSTFARSAAIGSNAGTTGTTGAAPGVWLDYGRDNYAGVTWSGVPTEDGRRLFLGWMSNWDYATVVPTATWRSAMTIPRTLTLHRTRAGLRLYSAPVKELRALRGEFRQLAAQRLGTHTRLQLPRDATASSIELDFEFVLPANGSSNVALELSNSAGDVFSVGYDHSSRTFYTDRRATPHAFSPKFAAALHSAVRTATDSIVQMHIFIDRASVELFADGGATVMTDIVFPSQRFTDLHLASRGDAVRLTYATLHGLRSIWQ
jgi:fructan beta-fructosidase